MPDQGKEMVPVLDMDNYEPDGLKEYQDRLFEKLQDRSGTVQPIGDLTGA